MQKFSCSKCNAILAVASVPPEGKIGCPHCGAVLTIAPPSGSFKAPSASSSQMRAPGTVPPAPRPAAPRPSAHRPAPRVDYDRPRRKTDSSSTTLWLVLGGVGLLLVVVLVVVLVMAMKGDDSGGGSSELAQKQPRPNSSRRGPPDWATRPTRPAPPPRSRPPVSEPSAETPPPEPARDKNEVARGDEGSDAAPTYTGGGGDGDSGVNVYPYVLKSVTFIIVPMGADEIAAGSGSLIDRKNRLVLTNHHVAGQASRIAVFFPRYDRNNKLISEKQRFFEQLRSNLDIIEAKVIASDERRDLCIIQLSRLPAGVEILPLAKEPPKVGQRVHSLGNPGTSGALWVYAPGIVRQVYRKKWLAGDEKSHSKHEAEIVETQSPTNHGDSGGPLVNDRGELVGVTQGGTVGEGAQVSIFISVNEVRSFVENAVRDRLRTSFAPENRALLAPGGARPVVAAASLAELVKRLQGSDAAARNKAVEELGKLGPAARDALPTLIKVLTETTDDFTRRTVLTTLEKIGVPPKSDVRLLAETLQSQSPEARRYAAATLEKMGPDARGAGPQLVAALRDGDPHVKQAAARTIGLLGVDMKDQAKAPLEEMLQDSDPETRAAAANAWCGLLTASRDVAALRKLVKHQDVAVRRMAAGALCKFGKDAKGFLPEILEQANGDTGDLRRALLRLLAQLEPADAKLAVNQISSGLKADDKETKLAALAAAMSLGKELPPTAIADLKTLLDDDDTRATAISALGKLAASHKPAAQALGELLKDGDEATKDTVLKVLGDLGPGAAGALSEMIAMMELQGDVVTEADRDRVMKVAAAIAKIGKPAIPALRKEVTSTRTTRWGAAIALGNMGPIARDALRDLQAAYQREPNAFIRRDLEEAARKISNR